MTSYVFRPSRKKDGKSVRSRIYWGGYRLPGDQKETRLSLETSDKQVAQQKLREIIREKEQEAGGILVPKKLRDSAHEPIVEHLQFYLANLTAQNRDNNYIYNVGKRLSKLAKEAGWKYLRDVTRDSFEQWRSRQNLAPKTLNDYLAAASAFFCWMEGNGRVSCNPLEMTGKVEERGNERRKRRAFTLEEMNRLLGVSGSRQVGYLAAFFTGLRRAELKQLQWGDVHFETDPPFLSVRASTTKNHERADIFLHEQLEAALRRLRPVKARGNALVFQTGSIPSMDEMREDLAAAGIAYKDEQGRQADFHALRGSLCTHLAIHGVDPHVRKEIMRHSELSLTLRNYTDVRQLNTSSAIRALPSFTPQRHAVPCAVDSDAGGHCLAHDGANEGEIDLAEVPWDQGDSHAMASTGTSGRALENGCLTRTRT